MKYYYKAKKISGEETSGVLEAKDRYDLARLLRANGYVLTSYKNAAGRRFSVDFLNFGNVSTAEKMIFSRNMAAMISAGIPVARALDTLARQGVNGKLSKALSGMVDNIRKGNTLSQSMAAYPKIFSSLFVAMMKVGEESGNLSESLKLTASQLEREHTLQRRIKGALMYPLIIVLAMVGIGALMMIYVVPTLVSTFSELGAELPGSTLVIINISNFLVHHPIYSALTFVASFSVIFWAIRTPAGRKIVSDSLFYFPFLSSLVKKINAARTARTMSSLVASGVGIVESLEITKDVLQNYRYKNVIDEAKSQVQKGEPISAVFLKHQNIYPSLVGEMVAAGEETGKLAEMFSRLADFYEEEVAEMTKDLSTVIEPIVLILIGAAVGFFTISMVKPLYSVLNGV